MRDAKHVVLLRSGNRLVVDQTAAAVVDVLRPVLTYTERRFAHGREQFERKQDGLKPFEEIEWACYGEDHKGRLATSFGFLGRITTALEANGYTAAWEWATAEEAAHQAARVATVFTPRWDRVNQHVLDTRTDPADPATGFQFRYRQLRALKLMAEHEGGRISCPTGWGKGTLIMLLCVLFPKAKVDITTKSIPVLKQRLYPELAQNLPSVGMVGGGVNIKGKRVMCYSADSLHHGRSDADFVLVDEGHQACADSFAAKLAAYESARVWMFSASWDMRLDNKDMRAEALAGPIRLVVTYKEAELQGMVVPIEVVWTDVVTDTNPCSGVATLVKKKQTGIWTNTYRNELIARDANHYDADTQVLITVETLEHAMNLKELLPDFTVVYSGQGLKPEDVEWFTRRYPDTFVVMTPDKKADITAKFERGELKKAIATTVWNVGVNFLNLEVLIRADAGGSPINDTQIPGRNSRINAKIVKVGDTKKKLVAILHDYRDQFDAGFSQKAKRREGSYKTNEWRQHFPTNNKASLLRRLMNFGGEL